MLAINGLMDYLNSTASFCAANVPPEKLRKNFRIISTVFELFSSITMSETTEKEAPKFLVDGMLGSLSRKLRMLGFDTIYDSSSADSELRSLAKITNRILLTGDVELYITAKRSKIGTILV